MVIGVDFYNHSITGAVTMTLSAARADAHKIPCVLIINSSGGVSPERLTQVITKDRENARASKEST